MECICIFDLDGTLYEVSNPITKIIDSKIEKYIIKKSHLTIKEYQELETKIPDLLIALKVLNIDKQDFYNHIYENQTYEKYFYPDLKLKKLLIELKAKKIICTNSSKTHAINVLKNLKLKNQFDEIYSTEDYDCKQDIYKTIINKYKVLPGSIFVIGDNYDVDLKPAEALKCHIIHINKAGEIKNCYEAIKIINKKRKEEINEQTLY